MSHTHRLLAALALTLLLGPWAHAQTPDLDAAKRADIEQLLSLMRATDMAKASMGQVAGQLVQQQQQQNPRFTAEHARALIEAQQAVVDENLGTLGELFVQLYHRHFGAEDIRQMLVFYRSDTGQRLLQAMPALNRESIEAGMQFGRLLAPKIEQRVQEKFKARGLSL